MGLVAQGVADLGAVHGFVAPCRPARAAGQVVGVVGVPNEKLPGRSWPLEMAFDAERLIAFEK